MKTGQSFRAGGFQPSDDDVSWDYKIISLNVMVPLPATVHPLFLPSPSSLGKAFIILKAAALEKCT